MEPQPIWRKKRSTSAPASESPSPEASALDVERRRHHHGRRCHSRRGHRRRSFSPVGKGAAGEALPPKSVVSPPQQSSLVSDSNIVMLNELLDRSLREEGLTSNIADLLSILIGRDLLTSPESSSLRVGSSVPSAPSMSMSANTRMAMSNIGAVSNFPGNENDKNSILNVMAQYEAFVIAALKSRPGVTDDMIDRLLMAYFIFVSKDEAIQFYTQLVGSQVPWRRSSDGTQPLSDAESSAKPTSWSEMTLAFETSYLSADAVTRSVEQIVTLRQGPSESVTSYVNRHRDSFNNLNRQVERQHVPPLEALQMGVLSVAYSPTCLSYSALANTASLCRKPLTGHNVVPRQWRQSMAP